MIGADAVPKAELVVVNPPDKLASSAPAIPAPSDKVCSTFASYFLFKEKAPEEVANETIFLINNEYLHSVFHLMILFFYLE